MFAQNNFSDRSLGRIELNKEALDRITRLSTLIDPNKVQGQTKEKGIINQALSLYIRTAEAEQSGSDVVAFPVRLGELALETGDFRKIRFEFSASQSAFIEKYKSPESLVGKMFGPTLRISLDPALFEQFRLHARRVGVQTPKDFILHALDRFAVILEYRAGEGLFTTEPHAIAVLNESKETYSILEF